MKITFETLPSAIEQLNLKLERIEALLSSPTPQPIVKDTMLIDEAIEFLQENGRPTSKSTIYKESSLGWIPAQRVGKRLVFSRKELKTWIESGMPKQSELDAADSLAGRIMKNERSMNKNRRV